MPESKQIRRLNLATMFLYCRPGGSKPVRGLRFSHIHSNTPSCILSNCSYFAFHCLLVVFKQSGPLSEAQSLGFCFSDDFFFKSYTMWARVRKLFSLWYAVCPSLTDQPCQFSNIKVIIMKSLSNLVFCLFFEGLKKNSLTMGSPKGLMITMP